MRGALRFIVPVIISALRLHVAVWAQTPDPTPVVPLFDYTQVEFTRGSESARPGGELVFEISGDPAHLNPLTSKDDYEATVNQFIISSLVIWDIDTNEPLPMIADGWKITSLPDGGQEFLFHINPRATFSDGVPITADDVLFSINAVFEDAYPTAHNRPYYESVKKIEKLDDKTVKFITRDTYYLNFSMLGSLQILPKHLYQPFMDARYKEKKDNPDPNLNLHPVGSGPYEFVSWTRGKQIILKRNRNWWGDALPHMKNCYNFDTIHIKIIRDSKIAYEHFKRGDIDYYSFSAAQWVKETKTEAFQSGKLIKLEVQNKMPRGYTFIGWNLIDPKKSNMSTGEWVPNKLFGAARVRRAMTHLIDRELYIDKYKYRYSIRCTSPFGNRSDYSDPDVKPLDFDPDKALELLRQEGWDDHDLDSILDKEIDGRKIDFRFTLLIPADSPAMEAMATIIREDMRAVGIIMNIRSVEWNSFQTLTDEKTFDAFTMGWTGATNPDPRSLWHSASCRKGGNNLVTFINKRVDELSEEGVRTTDRAKRIALFREIHRILHREQPYTFLTEPLGDLLGINSRIHLMINPKTGKPYFNYGLGAVKYWWVKSGAPGEPEQ